VRIPAVLTLALAAVAAHAQQPGPDHFRARTAADLARLCSTAAGQPDQASAVAFCHGVLAGAYGYYDVSVAAADRFVCLPNPGPTRSQIASGFVSWLKARPQYNDGQAVDVLFRYAGETFPCKR